ncbi:MAG: hypothetical protein AB7S78_13150 [Candidatus Omnitrophota bacterium]
MMKLFKILIMIMVAVSFLPLEGDCSDHADEATAHHCVLVCHTCCHQVDVPVLQDDTTGQYPGAILSFAYNFSYVNPIRLNPERPPKFHA